MIGWSLQQNIRDRIQTFILVIILSWKNMLAPKPAEVYYTIFSTCCWDGIKAYISVYLNFSVTCYTHIKEDSWKSVDHRQLEPEPFKVHTSPCGSHTHF